MGKKKSMVLGGGNPEGNDHRKINEMATKGINRPRPGVLIHLYVTHDDWCQKLHSGGLMPCNCNADIRVEEEIL